MGTSKARNLLTTTEIRRKAEELVQVKTAKLPLPRTNEETQRLVHELEVHQIELELQNAELCQARDEVAMVLDKYTDLFDFAPIGYFTLGRDSAIRAVNLAGASLLGVDRSQLLGRRFGLFFADEVRLFFADFLEKVFAGQVKESCEVTLTRKGHSSLFVRIEAVALGAGQECRVAVIDITKRKQVEEALLQSEQQFRTLADAIPQLSWMANADGGIFWCNQRWYDFTGTTPEQMYEWGWQSVHDPKWLPQVLEQWKVSISSGNAFEMVFPLRSSDGEFRLFLTRAMPVCDHDGKVVRWFGTNTDISELKRAQEALDEKKLKLEELNRTLEVRIRQGVDEMRLKDKAMIQQNSLAALGQMINNIAHQWRQPLNVVSIIIQSIQLNYASGVLTSEEMNSDIQNVMENIMHMSQTIEDFRNFFKQDKLKQEFFISEAVNRAI